MNQIAINILWIIVVRQPLGRESEREKPSEKYYNAFHAVKVLLDTLLGYRFSFSTKLPKVSAVSSFFGKLWVQVEVRMWKGESGREMMKKGGKMRMNPETKVVRWTWAKSFVFFLYNATVVIINKKQKSSQVLSHSSLPFAPYGWHLFSRIQIFIL